MDGCLRDLTSQTLYAQDAMEIVVIDSGSPEGEQAIVRAWQRSHPRIVYCRTERETIYAAWNRAVLASRGTLLVNANCDDRHAPDCFEQMAQLLERESVGLAYVDALVTSNPNERFEAHNAKTVWCLPPFNLRQALLTCPYGCTVMWRRDVHASLGLFDEAFTIAGDYEFFLRVSLAHGAAHLARPLSLYHESAGSVSHRDPARLDRELARFLPRLRRWTCIERIYPSLERGAATRSPSDGSDIVREGCTAPEDFASAHLDFGNLLLDPRLRGSAPDAEFHYRRALELAGPRPAILWNVAQALRLQGRIEEADATRAVAVRRNPSLEGLPPQSLIGVRHPVLNRMPPVVYETWVPFSVPAT